MSFSSIYFLNLNGLKASPNSCFVMVVMHSLAILWSPWKDLLSGFCLVAKEEMAYLMFRCKKFGPSIPFLHVLLLDLLILVT
ncbi:hypothetical protein U1Q18_014940 [Sarracenia purpurea var. burkii]